MLLRDADLKAPPSGLKLAKGATPGSALQTAALGLHPTKAVVPILAKALASPNPAVDRAAVILLGRVGPDARSTAPALIAATNALIDSKGGRANGEGPQFSDYASALVQILPAEEAVSVLSKAMGPDHRAIRTPAATALGKLGPKGQAAVPVLLGSLKEAGNLAGGRGIGLRERAPPVTGPDRAPGLLAQADGRRGRRCPVPITRSLPRVSSGSRLPRRWVISVRELPRHCHGFTALGDDEKAPRRREKPRPRRSRRSSPRKSPAACDPAVLREIAGMKSNHRLTILGRLAILILSVGALGWIWWHSGDLWHAHTSSTSAWLAQAQSANPDERRYAVSELGSGASGRSPDRGTRPD